jgi:PAS domain S-box-containing protein
MRDHPGHLPIFLSTGTNIRRNTELIMVDLPSFGITGPGRRNRTIVLSATTALAFAANIWGLFLGITVVFSHLLYFPIILAGYWFPRRGIVFSACMAAAYGAAALLLSPVDIMTTTAVFSRCAIFLVIGAVVSFLSERLSESEQRLHDIIEFLPDPTFAIDPAGTVIAWNRAIEEMTGIRKAEMVGRGSYEYALPFYGKREPVLIDTILDESAGPAARYLNAGKESGRLEADVFLPRFRNGKGVYLRLAATALFDPGGRLAGAIESIRDVTDQVITEAALKNTGTRLNALAGIIRHDLGKKLADLNSRLAAGARYSSDPGFAGWIATMQESADGIGEQIGISAEFREIGATPPGWQPVQYAAAGAAARNRSGALSFGIWTERLEIFSDPHITEGFHHLFERAAGTSAGAKRVVVSYRVGESGCMLCIEDDGQGFPEDAREGLFRKRDEEFGCGLFLAKEIFAITSITVRESGTFGHGTRFEILVPPEGYRIQDTGPGMAGNEKTSPMNRPEDVSRREGPGAPVVRELRADEFPLAAEAWAEYHGTTADPATDRVFAVILTGTIVALARCRRHPDGLEVDGIFTLPAFRSKGYSRLAVGALVEACHNDDLYMHAVTGLTAFYRSFGFEPIAEQVLPPTIRERYLWAAGNLEGAEVQPMHRRSGM